MDTRDGASDNLVTTPKPESIAIRRGTQARVPSKAAIIGGGKACDDLLTFLADGRLARLGMEILGVADPDTNAPGIRRARAMEIFTTQDFSQLFTLPGLNLIIELTGSTKVREQVIQSRPLHVSCIDHRGARLLWDLIQIETEKQILQREAEETIRRERDWFQKLIDSLPDSILILNDDRTIKGVNKTFLAERGLPEDYVIGRRCYEVTHGRSEECRGPGLTCPFDGVMRTKESCSTIHPHVTPEGEYCYHEITCAPILGDSGEIAQVIEGIRNVTRRIMLERELRESERKLRQFLDSTHDIICIKDTRGHYLYINPAGAETMGLSPGEVVGRTDFDLFPPHIAAVMAARDAEVLSQHTTRTFQGRMRTESKVHQFHTVRFPIPGDGGQAEALCVVARDMTDEVALQEEVRKNEEYLENVLNHSSDMIITTNFDGFIVTFNPAAEKLLGYKKEEMLGSHVEGLWKKPEERRELMEEVGRLGAVNNYPAVLIAKDGTEVEISLSLSQLRDRRGRVLGTVGVSKDVTEENRMRRKLLEQERLVAIGETIAGITHCIKNLLNGLKGGVYILNTGLKRDDPALVKEGWKSVQRGIERIGKLSLDMLTYCRDRTPSLTPMDPLVLLRETVEVVSKSAVQEGIDILAAGDEGPPVALDSDSMSRALLNLLSNAVDACRGKSYGENERPLIEARVQRKEGEIAFLVKDNGEGMTEETKFRLFKRFFSTKEAKGTGLGLCVTQKIVDEHGGRIEVESLPGRGSTFMIVLPTDARHEPAGDTSKQ
ncbi:MAG: PAS domain-containing protein [Deltaproteobacteria bacterium]|nr:PAS domain-containing protein [Deltaproteobacteria bacterium]